MQSHEEESCGAFTSLEQTQNIERKHMEQAEKIPDNNIKENKMSEKDEMEENSIWIYIPDDVLELIMKFLCLKDYLELRTICCSWRVTVTNAIAHQHCYPLPELPVIILKSKEERLFSLSTEHERCPKTPLLGRRQTCHGSVEGWMIVSDYVEKGSLSFFFFNPVTNNRILVPQPLSFPSNSPMQAELLMGKMVASCRPDCYNSECFLVGLFNDYCHIAFHRLLGKDWTFIERLMDSEIQFMEVEIIGTKLYVRTNNSLEIILVYDLKVSNNGCPPKPKLLAKLPQGIPSPVSSIIGNQRHVWGHVNFYLAKDEALGELFLVCMFCNTVYETDSVGHLNIVTDFVTPPKITGAQVFKLDMSKEPIRWLKYKNLGDHVVFISRCKSMVMSRSALNNTQESIKGNSVYFAVRHGCPLDPWSGVQMGMISVTDNTIKYFSVEKSNYFDVPYPFWFVPSV